MDAQQLFLNNNERNAAQEFLNKLPKKYRYNDVELIFSNGGGIGVGVTIRVGDKEKDITDYNSW